MDVLLALLLPYRARAVSQSCSFTLNNGLHSWTRHVTPPQVTTPQDVSCRYSAYRMILAREARIPCPSLTQTMQLMLPSSPFALMQACSSLTRLIMPTSSDAVALDGNHTGIATTSTPPAQLHTGPGQRPLAGLGPGHTENGSLLPADCLLPLTWLPKLQVLDLSGSGVGDAGLALLLQQASALTSLALDGCRNISGQAWTASHQASPASCETTHEPAAPAAAAQIAEGAWAPATALTGAPATTSLTGHPVAASTSCSQHASQGTRPASPCAVVRLSLLNTGLSASGLRELCLPLSSIQRQRPMGQFTEQADQLNVSASASGSHGCLSALPEHTLPCAAPLLGNVAVLRLCATQVDTGAALLPLCSLPQLSNLTLQALSARGEALLVLRKAPSLRRVDLFGCPLVTRAAASALLDASNTCRVVQLDGAVLWPESIAGAGTVKQGTAGLRSLGKPATQVATMVKADEGLRGQRVSAGGGHLAKFDQRRRYTRHELQELQPHCDSAGRCVLSKLLLENLEGWMLKSGEDEKW